MSRTYKRVPSSKNEVDEVTCNACGTKFVAGVDDEDIENCIFIVKTFGYSSKRFGDMTTVNIDICEYCAHNMFGLSTEAIHEYSEPWIYEMRSEQDGEEDLTIETPTGTITFRR